MLRYHHATDETARSRPARLNLLLTYGGWREAPAVQQLARLLEPMGISSVNADSGEEAAHLIRAMPIHIAVVDLTIPFHAARPEGAVSRPGGGRILQLLGRLRPAPPTVIIRPRQPASRESARGLSEALREGAFAVVDRPVNLETMLEVMRRVLCRHYADHWPDA